MHVFGASSSPSCANFALRHTVLSDNFNGNETLKQIVLHCFYVDDLMVYVNDEYIAISLIDQVINLLKINGFNLTGFTSNSRKILRNIYSTMLAKSLSTVNINNDLLPRERALGVLRNV